MEKVFPDTELCIGNTINAQSNVAISITENLKVEREK